MLIPFRRKRTTLSPHESVMFYPSFGYRTEADTWTIVIQGCVYQQSVTWLRRKPVLAVIRRAMKVTRDGDVYFRQRMRQFLVHFSSGRLVSVRLASQAATFGPTELAGLFRGEMQLGMDEIRTALESHQADVASPLTREHNWVPFEAVLPEKDARSFGGSAQLLETHGVSIISDVDDTLKHSNVPDRRDLFHNTFARDFIPVPGMPELFRAAATRGAAFHYVSGSPWQLYEPLAEFWQNQGYPRGSFHLKRFRLRESARKLHHMSPQQAHKQAAIAPILTAFPRRRFVLIGDSGEQDPEIYAKFLRERPEQVVQVLIRAVRGAAIDEPRLRRTFAGLPETSWSAYESTSEITELLLGLVDRYAALP